MRRAERLFRMVQELRARDVTRACDLARTLEISLSTVYRDIAHLQGSGLPIEGEAGVGYLLRPGFDLPGLTFTHDQLDALALGLAFAQRTGDADLARAASEVRATLQAALPDPKARRLADAPLFSLHPRRQDAGPLALLRRAIRLRQVVAFDYATPGQASGPRRLRPLAIWDMPGGFMVSGWCEMRADFRTFRADRITQLAATGAQFTPDAQTDLAAFLSRESCG